MNKKAQTIAGVSAIVFTIATLIIGVIIALIVVTNVGSVDDNLYTTITGTAVTNETVTGLAEAGDNLAYYYLNGCSATVSAVINSSDNVLILATENY
jgi:hypothetical protein